MHVLHVSEVSWGGVVSLLNDFMTEQLRRGHRVGLLAPVVFPDLALPEVHRSSWVLDRRRPTTYPRAVAQLRRTIRRTRPDIVHLHSAFAGFFGRLPGLSVPAGVPVVYQPHAWSFEAHADGRAKRVTQAWEQFAGAHTDVLVTNCDDEIEQGRLLDIRTDGIAIGVPVDVERFHPVDAVTRARHRSDLGVVQDKMLLCLGRLAHQKGQDRLVTAWEAGPLPDTELLLVGPGDPELLRRLAPSQWGRSIRWLDGQTDVRPHLWACDALVMPSRYEGAAVTPLEAMACGRPVIASRVNGINMAVADGPYAPGGRVVAKDDMDALLGASREFLDSPQLQETWSQGARERTVALFPRSRVVDRLDDAYSRAVQVRR